MPVNIAKIFPLCNFYVYGIQYVVPTVVQYTVAVVQAVRTDLAIYGHSSDYSADNE